MTRDDVRGIVGTATEHAVKDRTARLVTWLAFGFLVVCLAGGGAYLSVRMSELSSRADENAEAASVLADQVRDLGGTPRTDVPEPAQGPQGKQGERGPAPSQEQVSAAVAAYCARTECAPPPTPQQVAVAVSTYCDSRGECRGPRGAEGEQGEDGTAGTSGTDGLDGQDGSDGSDGSPGPPPSEDQVRAAVVSYCTENNNCQGPQGPAGQQGDPGRPPTHEEILAAVNDFFANRSFYCTPPPGPIDRLTGEPWRCSMASEG